MIKELVKGTAEPLVLRILSDGPLHGYAILQQIKERFHEALPSGRRRKVYCITPAGHRRLTEAKDHLECAASHCDGRVRDGSIKR